MCGSKCGGRGTGPGAAGLQHLPTPLLSAIFHQLPPSSWPAFSASCCAFRTAALQAMGRALVSRALVRRPAGLGFAVTPPHFLAPLTMLSELLVDLDASLEGVTAEDVLGALRAALACLPHCQRRVGAPRLRLRLRVALPPPRRALPELEAHRLQHLLRDVGLLPHGLECLHLDSPCFTLDGGLADTLCAAHLLAEHHLLEGLLASGAGYARLSCLSVDCGTPASLEAFGELVAQGQFPALRALRLARQYPTDPPSKPWDPLEAERRERVLTAIAAARAAGAEYAAAGCSGGSEQPPEPADCSSPVADSAEMLRLGLLPARAHGPCAMCGRRQPGCRCDEAYAQLAVEHGPCYCGASLGFLQRLPQLSVLELANFSLSAPGAPRLLPRLPGLLSLALTHERWFRRLPGFQLANADGELAAALADAMPALCALRLDCLASDAGLSAIKGLTSLVVDQGCGPARWEAFGGFPWDACRLRRLEEVQLRGGWGWMVRHATWRGLLQPKGFYAPGLGRLRRLVFDVRGWQALPDHTSLEAFLEAVLDVFVNDSLRGLDSIHAVLEQGPYRPSKNEGYLKEEGPLGAWGAAHDEFGDLWVAVLAAEQTPRVILMQRLGASGGEAPAWVSTAAAAVGNEGESASVSESEWSGSDSSDELEA